MYSRPMCPYGGNPQPGIQGNTVFYNMRLVKEKLRKSTPQRCCVKAKRHIIFVIIASEYSLCKPCCSI